MTIEICDICKKELTFSNKNQISISGGSYELCNECNKQIKDIINKYEDKIIKKQKEMVNIINLRNEELKIIGLIKDD